MHGPSMCCRPFLVWHGVLASLTFSLVLLLWCRGEIRALPRASTGVSIAPAPPAVRPKAKNVYVFPGDLVTPKLHSPSFWKFYTDTAALQMDASIPVDMWFLTLSDIFRVIDKDGEDRELEGVMIGGQDIFTSEVLERVRGINIDPTGSKNAPRKKTIAVKEKAHPVRVVELLRQEHFKRDFDVFKVDFDGYDCDILEAVFGAGYRPTVIVMEVNPAFPPPIRFSMGYCESFEYSDGHPLHYGCSLQQIVEFLMPHHYVLVQFACTDVWFVKRSALIGTPLLAMEHVTPREHYERGNPLFWSGVRGWLLTAEGAGSLSRPWREQARKKGNFLKEWFDLAAVDALTALVRIKGNMTRMVKEKHFRADRVDAVCPFSISLSYGEEK